MADQLRAFDARDPAAPDDGLPGPFAVGRYAKEFQGFLRKRPRLKLIGEVTGLRLTAKSVYFELRDAQGAVPCAMWRDDWDKQKLPEGAVRDGAEIVVAGGPDFYPGSRTASPSFSFRCTAVRLAGEGDLLVQLAELRRKLSAEGLFEPQKRLPRPALPRTIGIVTGRDSAAMADVIAGLERRSWRGTAVFAHPPVQDRHAAPRIARAISDLAAIESVEAIVIARGGGSLADLWAFCDETLCRTVALLRVPVISAVGHESDRTLLDDVAAVCCSTPTHAVEEAVRVDVEVARRRLAAAGDRALPPRCRCRPRARAPRRRLRPRPRPPHRRPAPPPASADPRDPRLRPAGGRPRPRRERPPRARPRPQARRRLPRRGGGRAASCAARRRRSARHRAAATAERGAALERLALTLAAHEPERVLERGYAIVEDSGGEVVTSAERARERRRLRVRFSDDHVEAEVRGDD